MSEPSYTSYLGTPRQDVPHYVYKDTAMYEDVFEKRGSFVKKPTHSIACPLSQEYDRLIIVIGMEFIGCLMNVAFMIHIVVTCI